MIPSTPNPPTPKLSPERRSAESLPSAALLAFTGGSLDAFLYLEHGKVFAGAMTGNAVLAGIAVLSHNRGELVQHLLPIAAFLGGAWLAKLLEGHLRHHAVTVGLAAEATGLMAASLLPRGFPDVLFVPCIAMLAAYQITSFRLVDTYAYNSTFITGNLRSIIDGLYGALMPDMRAACLRQSTELAVIVCSFGLGAIAGALLAPRALNHTLWLPVFTLLLVLGFAVRRTLHSAAL